MKMLPDSTPVVEIIPAPDSFVPNHHGPQKVYPDIQKLDDGRLIVDWWNDAPSWTGAPPRYVLKVWTRANHPNMAALPANAPRAVKALYSAAGQLKRLRSTECNGDFEAALIAWEKYQRVVGA